MEIPRFKTVMMANSDVKATCSVYTVFDAKVIWEIDGAAPSSKNVNQNRNTTHLISTLTVGLNRWKQLRLVKCKVEHPCLQSTEDTEAEKKVSGKRII